MSRPVKSIWLVWADRGSYSDRTEYAVCWYETEDAAREEAAKLRESSEVWRRKVCDADNFGAAWDRARLAVGDEQWAPSDETEYCVFELKRGPK